ncbi:hypothetical protein [Streptococcus porci]|uniref:hypothetical protein n=1 Tax=Streptococcus porci TaxID=502567 RepID=UPI000414C7CF|nr:hypothetical protein [Streptococcus porci]
MEQEEHDKTHIFTQVVDVLQNDPSTKKDTLVAKLDPFRQQVTEGMTDEDFTFLFPTSRLLAIDEGERQADKGIEPDVFITWTPEHFERNVDLETALAFLRDS